MTARVFDNQGPARSVVLRASSALAAAGTVNESAVTGLGAYRQAQILLDVTAAASAAGDTLDVYIDTSMDGGIVWNNVVHFTQVLGNGGAKQFWAVIDPGGAPAATVTAIVTDAAAGVVRPSMLGDQLRVRSTLVDGGAHGQTFTYSVKALLKR